jgi:hypothetical protein
MARPTRPDDHEMLSDCAGALARVGRSGRLRLDAPVPGLPLVRPDVTTNVGRVRLRHPGAQHRTRRRPGDRRRR